MTAWPEGTADRFAVAAPSAPRCRRGALVSARPALWPYVEQAFLFNTRYYGPYLDVQLTSPVTLLWQALGSVRHRTAT